MLDSEGHVKLADFGLSKEGMFNGEITSSFCGSYAYLAPEMVKKQGHTLSLDWYLVGVLLHEMLVGQPPYYSTNKDTLFKNILTKTFTLPNHLSNEAQSLI